MSARAALPRGVWVLGFVSLLMDVSSEMIHSLLPLYLTVGLGASALAVGLIEGVAEATALIVKVVSGVLSDRWRNRKGLAALGYGLGAFSKPFFAMATGPGLVFAARFADRIGKGIRGAPRDALVADLTPAAVRGAAFGLRQSLDTVGAFVGPLLAMALMLAWHDDFKAVFWIAVVPGVLSFLLIAFGVREPEAKVAKAAGPPRFNATTVRSLGRPFAWVAIAGATLTLARFSEAFLVLRGQSLGLEVALAPLVMVGMSAVFALSAYPAGLLADRMPARTLLIGGVALLIAADIVLAVAPGLGALGIGVALWGLHMGATQGLLAALVARTAPEHLRGTAFGVFNLACGLSMLAASVIAGALWQYAGPAATFIAGAAFATASAMIALRLN
jgi:MFS family permease